jgi:hypothetical protein
MVRSDGGQLFTIEGFAAALIMISTAYLVVNATSIYTAGDTHINDMQLETLGTDALTVMGTPMNTTEYDTANSTLQMILEAGAADGDVMFRTKFLELVNSSGTGPKQDIQFVANYTCRDDINNNISSLQPLSSSSRNLVGGEHPVRVTKWVIINKGNTPICNSQNKDRAVLVEVLLWRD